MRFGIKDLDEALSFLEIRGILSILSDPGCGAEVIAKSILSAEDGLDPIAIIMKETEEEFKKACAKYGYGEKKIEILDLGAELFNRGGALGRFLLGISKEGEILEDFVSQQRREERSWDPIARIWSELSKKEKTKAYIDCLDVLADVSPQEKVKRFLQILAINSRQIGSVIIITMEKEVDPWLERKLKSVSDVVISLRREISGKKVINEISVEKIKNYPYVTFMGRYVISPGAGVLIEKIEKI